MRLEACFCAAVAVAVAVTIVIGAVVVAEIGTFVGCCSFAEFVSERRQSMSEA